MQSYITKRYLTNTKYSAMTSVYHLNKKSMSPYNRRLRMT